MARKKLTFGLVIPHYPGMFSTFYTMEIIKSVSKGALSSKVDIIIHIAHGTKSKRTMFSQLFRSDIVSGILFADMMGNEDLVKKTRHKKIPYLIMNYFNKKSSDNCIGIDNEGAAVDVINYLVKLGHKRIAIITGKLDAQAGSDRLNGYKRGLLQNKLDINPDYIAVGDWTESSGERAMKQLLKLNKMRPTAVFVVGDEMAMGAMKVAKEAGLSIPKDISFVGFDDIPISASQQVCLTTVRQPLYGLGRLGVKYLKQIVLKEQKGKGPVKVLLKSTEIIKRKTTASI